MATSGDADTDSAQIKKLLSDPKHRIMLHNLVYKETEKVYKTLSTWDPQVAGSIDGIIKKRIAEAEIATETLRKIFAYGCYFGLEDQQELWTMSLNRLGTMPFTNGSDFLIKLQSYPAMLVMYAGGVNSLAGNRYYNLRSVLSSKAKTAAYGQQPLVAVANCTMLGSGANSLLGFENRKTPLSDHLNRLLVKDEPHELIYETDFNSVFDRWEVLLGMVVADNLRARASGAWAPVGAFSWRDEHSDERALNIIEQEMKSDNWGPLKVGLFDASPDRAGKAFAVVKELADGLANSF